MTVDKKKLKVAKKLKAEGKEDNPLNDVVEAAQGKLIENVKKKKKKGKKPLSQSSVMKMPKVSQTEVRREGSY